MENDNLTKTEFMAVRCLEIVAASLQARERELSAAIAQLQREQAAFQKDRAETFAVIEAAHGLEAGSLNNTHTFEPLVPGQSARIVQTAKPVEQPQEKKVETADAAASVN